MRIAHPGAVYRSKNPEHLAIARRNEASRETAISAMCDYAKTLVDIEEGHPDGPTAYGRSFDDGSFLFTGITVPRGTQPSDGLRVDTKARAKHGTVLVPRQKTEAGKVIASQMRALSFTAEHMGSVSHVVIITDGENRWFTQGVVEVIGDQVFAEYHHPISDRKNGQRPSDRAKVEQDPDWEPCALSDFYAAREQVSA